MENIQNRKLLYHLTTINTFESIVCNNLLSRNELIKRELKFTDTANHEILDGRERLHLADYVPFHFHIHTSYDTYVKNNNKDEIFIYLCLSRDYARCQGFYILPIHPTSKEQPIIYKYDEGFNKIRWDIMNLTQNDTLPDGVTDNMRIQTRMAECLSPKPIPISDFQSIAVKDGNSYQYVREILNKYKSSIIKMPFIDIKRDYF